MAEKERTAARVSIIVKPTIMDQNYRQLPDMLKYFGKNSKVQLHLQPFVGLKGDPHWVKDIEALKDVFQEILELKLTGHSVIGNAQLFQSFSQYVSHPPVKGMSLAHLDLGGKKRNCDIGLRSMTIFPNGEVDLCEFLGLAKIGNVHRQSLSDMYYGAIANEQRAKAVYCDLDCQTTCRRPTPLLEKARAFLRMG